MWVEKLAALKASAIVPNLGGRHERCEFWMMPCCSPVWIWYRLVSSDERVGVHAMFTCHGMAPRCCDPSLKRVPGGRFEWRAST